MMGKKSHCKPWTVEQVTKAAEKSASVRHYCSLIGIDNVTHYRRMKSCEEYSDAYTQGLQNSIDRNIKNIELIADTEDSKAFNAKLEASRELLNRREKMLVNLEKERYTTGDLFEQLDKITQDYTTGIIDEATARTLYDGVKARASVKQLVEIQPTLDAVKKLLRSD